MSSIDKNNLEAGRRTASADTQRSQSGFQSQSWSEVTESILQRIYWLRRLLLFLDSTRKQTSHPKGVRLRQLPYRILSAILGAEGNCNPRKYGGGGLTLGQTRTVFSSSAIPEFHISSSYTCRLRITSIVLMIDPHNQPLSHRLLRGTSAPGSIGRGQLQVPRSALVISPRNQPR